jgi:hypothetical protein
MIEITAGCRGEFDARKEIVGLMEKAGLRSWLEAPVEISQTAPGTLSIRDQGLFAFQHDLLEHQVAADPNIVIIGRPVIPPTVRYAVIITHGWLDKGQGDWPAQTALAMAACTDPNQWLCLSYDWRGGSIVFTSVMAAQYARDIAGPRLAKAVSSVGIRFSHIHLMGHSAGSWTIHSAAKQLAEKFPDASFHLTFLDAYVPSNWDPDQLGCIFTDDSAGRTYWADHYYTRDITADVTQYNLARAHNVDLTALDPLIVEHEFPYRWYYATITGHYTRFDEKKEDVITKAANVEYGFARSRQAGRDAWTFSQSLPMGNKAVKISKPNKD